MTSFSWPWGAILNCFEARRPSSSSWEVWDLPPSMGSFPLADLFHLGSTGWIGGGSLAGGVKADDDLVWRGKGGGGGSLGCDFPDTSFPGWPSIRSRRLVDGFLLKPMSACEEVPWRSASVKLGSPKSPKGSSNKLNWSNAPNSSSDWFNSMTCSSLSTLPSSVSTACWEEDPSGKKKPCSATVIFWSRGSLALMTYFGAVKDFWIGSYPRILWAVLT